MKIKIDNYVKTRRNEYVLYCMIHRLNSFSTQTYTYKKTMTNTRDATEEHTLKYTKNTHYIGFFYSTRFITNLKI